MKSAVFAAALAAQLGVARAQGMGSGSCPCVSTVRAAARPRPLYARSAPLRPLLPVANRLACVPGACR